MKTTLILFRFVYLLCQKVWNFLCTYDLTVLFLTTDNYKFYFRLNGLSLKDSNYVYKEICFLPTIYYSLRIYQPYPRFIPRNDRFFISFRFLFLNAWLIVESKY